MQIRVGAAKLDEEIEAFFPGCPDSADVKMSLRRETEANSSRL